MITSTAIASSRPWRPQRMPARSVHESSLPRRPSASASSSAQLVLRSRVPLAGLPSASNCTLPSSWSSASARPIGPGQWTVTSRPAICDAIAARRCSLPMRSARSSRPPADAAEQHDGDAELEPERGGRVTPHQTCIGMIRAVTESELEFEDRFEGPGARRAPLAPVLPAAVEQPRARRRALPLRRRRARAADRGGPAAVVPGVGRRAARVLAPDRRVRRPRRQPPRTAEPVPRRRRRPRGAARAAALHARTSAASRPACARSTTRARWSRCG